jgi:hypothetical protein
MYNILHTASAPGTSDAFRPLEGSRRRGLRALLRRRPARAEAAEPVTGGRLIALGRRVADDRLDEALR